MSTWKPFHLSLVLSVVSLFLVGCHVERRPKDLPKLYPAKIYVIQNGKPLDKAYVTLDSVSGKHWAIGGQTDENGFCEAYTLGKFRGAPLGTYDVSIRKTVKEEIDADFEIMPGSPRKIYQQRETVAAEFTTPGTLTLEVTSDGKTEVTFDVGEAVTE